MGKPLSENGGGALACHKPSSQKSWVMENA